MTPRVSIDELVCDISVKKPLPSFMQYSLLYSFASFVDLSAYFCLHYIQDTWRDYFAIVLRNGNSIIL